MRRAYILLLLLQCHWQISFAEGTASPVCAPHEKLAGHVAVVPVTLGGVPALLRIPAAVSLPPVLLWHGFGTPNSPNDLMDALPLDDVPSVKVYLELPLFGSRMMQGAPTLAQRQAADYVTQLFEPAILGAAAELPGIVKDLLARRCMQRNQGVGLFGFSAGGAAVLQALAEHGILIRAAVIVNTPVALPQTIAAVERATGHPYSWTTESKRIAKRSDAVHRAADIASITPPPALLAFQGKNDEVITPDGVIRLRDALEPLYRAKGADQRLRLVLLSRVSHSWTDSPTLETLRRESADWFNQFMSAS